MIPPELLHLATDLLSTRINQAARVEEVRRSLSPPMCYSNDPKEVHDVPNSAASLSPSASPSASPSPEPE